MKLRYSPTSPYVRKVTVAIAELGLDGRIEREATDPWDPGTTLTQENPLGKVPALITTNAGILYDSAVICEYLDTLAGGSLFPPPGPDRWRALRLHALGNGIIEAGVAVVIERLRRPEQYRWSGWIDRQLATVRRSLVTLEAECDDSDNRLTIGEITAGCALGYLDFRLAELDWRAAHPELAAWYAGFSARPSMTATVPKAP
jgi:glutathione S-transferase